MYVCMYHLSIYHLLALFFVSLWDNFLYVDMLDPRLYIFSQSIHISWPCVLIVVSVMLEGENEIPYGNLYLGHWVRHED